MNLKNPVGKESEVLKSHRSDHVFEEGKNGYCMQRPATDRLTPPHDIILSAPCELTLAGQSVSERARARVKETDRQTPANFGGNGEASWWVRFSSIARLLRQKGRKREGH